MKKVDINCVIKDEQLLPRYQSLLSSGADLCYYGSEILTLPPGKRLLVPTGLFLELPGGIEAQVRPRSGLAVKRGVTVLNAPGTIDADYRGEVKVILINHGEEPFLINPGDRIAQLVIAPVIQGHFIRKNSLQETDRGAGGFGSTGI